MFAFILEGQQQQNQHLLRRRLYLQIKLKVCFYYHNSSRNSKDGSCLKVLVLSVDRQVIVDVVEYWFRLARTMA
jgi:hypothetical protein